MRRAAVAVVLLAMLTTSVFAQGRGQQQRQETPEEIQKKKEVEAVDQQYKSTLQRTKKEENVRVDPWANMRAPNDGKR
ncbi:MAG TPA: hypothetical protein VEH78_09770 [Pseudolabrys sp.]|nr:hypothetical protein [Pseudolabrys sp.]